MNFKRKHYNFIQKLHNLICNNELMKDKIVIWDNQGRKIGFTIINSYKFHKICKEKMITKSKNFKSLFRQLNNYGFKYADGFCYHPSSNFFKDSKYLKKIVYKEHKKEVIKKEKKKK